MKKAIIVIAFFFTVLLFSAGIVDAISLLTHDINNHAWQSIIGRWKSCERGYYEIEFKPDGTLAEYSHGISRSSGAFRISGNSIEITYDNCTPRKNNPCTVSMEFEFVADALILTANGVGTRFRRVDDAVIGMSIPVVRFQRTLRRGPGELPRAPMAPVALLREKSG